MDTLEIGHGHHAHLSLDQTDPWLLDEKFLEIASPRNGNSTGEKEFS